MIEGWKNIRFASQTVEVSAKTLAKLNAEPGTKIIEMQVLAEHIPSGRDAGTVVRLTEATIKGLRSNSAHLPDGFHKFVDKFSAICAALPIEHQYALYRASPDFYVLDRKAS